MKDYGLFEWSYLPKPECHPPTPCLFAHQPLALESDIYRNIWGVIPNNVTKDAPQSNIVLGDLQRELDKARKLVGKGLEYLVDEPHGIEHAIRDLESINMMLSSKYLSVTFILLNFTGNKDCIRKQ